MRSRKTSPRTPRPDAFPHTDARHACRLRRRGALPDDGRHEILDGQHVTSPAPRTVHERLVGDLFAELRVHARAHRLGEVFVAPFDVLLGDHDIVQPDVCLVAAERRLVVDAESR